MRSQIPKSLCSMLVMAGCASGVDGPTPALSRLAISPALVCTEQVSTTLDIRGQSFSPVPASLPGDARLLLPTFSLMQSAQLDGSNTSRVALVYSGDPEQSENVGALRWLSETHMQATLDDQRVIDGSRRRLPAGVYDARVINPSGEASSAADALTVVDKPSFAEQTELLWCTSRVEPVTVEGSGFLRVADELPTLRVQGQSDAWSISELSECTALGAAELCSRALLTVRSQVPPGSYDAQLVNPGPAACHTEDTLRIRVVAGPQLEADPIESLCMRGQARVLAVHGQSFQDVNGTLPSATLGGKAATVVALADCVPTGAAARSCKQLQIELPMGGLAAAEGGTTLVVTNPPPASCSASANLQLRELLQREGSSVKACLER